ncbi:hypothetical protein Rhopal_006016-T1 [Rhodotorula paludigena]|uniref:DUF202 domain-containing protein n=1 Tax=Rhodotorula paludigena TaxID=86838 RepID=A0AAV5GK02_9BASI|nr:hypothetical protein Rhopal_006016-T1 [Rhodotorula paludigena]
MQRDPPPADQSRASLLPLVDRTPRPRPVPISTTPSSTAHRNSYGSMEQRPGTAPVLSPASPSSASPPSRPTPPSPGTLDPAAHDHANAALSPPVASGSSSALRYRNGATTNGDSPRSPSTTAPATPAAPTPPPATAPTTQPRHRKKWFGLVFELENKGSVARDHLASERTFLAWVRTSMGLATVGIAVTQLFRLPSTSTVNAPNASATPSSSSDLASALASLASSNPSLAPLVPLLEAQQQQLEQATALIKDSTRYRHLGKPIGGTFIMLALVFLFLGIHRYFAIQTALMREPSQFPPSRRSVGFATFCIISLILATFVAILSIR